MAGIIPGNVILKAYTEEPSYNHNTLITLRISVNELLQMHFKVVVRTFHVPNVSRPGDSLTDVLKAVSVLWLYDELGCCIFWLTDAIRLPYQRKPLITTISLACLQLR